MSGTAGDADRSRPDVRVARWGELDPVTAYAILRLRVEVFVVEQDCPYPDPDGRDLEPDAQQLWLPDPDDPARVLATLRLLSDPGLRRIGRVCTAPAARGAGLAARLLLRALELCGDDPVVLDAQEPLADWYARLGFAVTGDRFLDDGIWHLPMRRG